MVTRGTWLYVVGMFHCNSNLVYRVATLQSSVSELKSFVSMESSHLFSHGIHSSLSSPSLKVITVIGIYIIFVSSATLLFWLSTGSLDKLLDVRQLAIWTIVKQNLKNIRKLLVVLNGVHLIYHVYDDFLKGR